MTVQRHPLRDHAEQHEDVGDHDRREQLQEVLDPEVDDPEPPEVGDGEVAPRVGEQADGVEGGDRQRGEEEEPGHVARCARCAAACAGRGRGCTTQKKSPIDEQDLPEAAEIEVLEALVAEPGPERSLRQPWMPANSPDQAADDDDAPARRAGRRRASSGRAARARRSSARGRCRRRGTRWRPRGSRAARARCGPGCTGAAARGRCRRSSRARRGSAARRRRPGSGRRNSAAITKKNQAVARWAGVSATSPGAKKRQRLLLAPVPAEQVPASEGGEQQPDAAEQGDEREHAPDQRRRRSAGCHQRLGRPVVRVGVALAGPHGGRRPGRPGEEGRQLSDLLRIGDRRRAQPIPRGGLAEERCVVAPQRLRTRRAWAALNWQRARSRRRSGSS